MPTTQSHSDVDAAELKLAVENEHQYSYNNPDQDQDNSTGWCHDKAEGEEIHTTLCGHVAQPR